MNITSEAASAMTRIGEIDRTEVIEARYRCVATPDGDALVLTREELAPPETLPDWDEAGVRRRAAWWRREVEAGGALFFAEEDGVLAGFAVLGPEKPGHCAELVALFVDRAQRGRGLGRRLVRHLEEEARRRGLAGLYVQSNDTVASVEFYRVSATGWCACWIRPPCGCRSWRRASCWPSGFEARGTVAGSLLA